MEFDAAELRMIYGQQARLVTLDLLYHMPDHPSLLQSFLWQTYDEIPGLPRIERFIEYWQRHIEAAISSVKVTAKDPGGRPLVLTPSFVTSLH